jgi:hypothetical protein
MVYFLFFLTHMFTTASRNAPLSNPTGCRGIDCTKLKICATIHWHLFLTPTVLFFISHPAILSFEMLTQIIIHILLIVVIFLGSINHIVE